MRLAIVLALIACKSETSSPPASGSGSAPAVDADLAAMIPKVDAAKVMGTKSPNGARDRDAYALETWCIDEADAVARVTRALERDGWTNVRVRGDAPSQAIAAMKGDIRFSGRTGGPDSRCAGTAVTATVMRLGNLDEQLLEGKR